MQLAALNVSENRGKNPAVSEAAILPEREGEVAGSAVAPVAGREIRLAQGVVDLARREVRYRDGSSCELSAREMDLLTYLAGKAGRVVSRDEILERVWGLNPMRIITRVIDMHIVHLRGKLRDHRKPRVLQTVHGRGYLFVKPNDEFARTLTPAHSPDGGEGEAVVASLNGRRRQEESLTSLNSNGECQSLVTSTATGLGDFKVGAANRHSRALTAS